MHNGLNKVLAESFSLTRKNIILLLTFSLSVTIIFHLSWWLDSQLGWTEKAVSVPNLLGYIHFFLHITMVYVLSTFVWNIYRLKKSLVKLNESLISKNLKYNFDEFCLKKSGGLYEFSNLFMKGITPIVILSIYITLIIITQINYLKTHEVEVWVILEVVAPITCYVLIIYNIVRGTVNQINSILIRHRESEMKRIKKSKALNSGSNKINNEINKHRLIETISNYPTSILNKETIVSPNSIRLIVFLLLQIIYLIIKLSEASLI